MQIEQVGSKGLFGNAKVSGVETDTTQVPPQKAAKSQGISRDSAPQTQAVTYAKPEKEETGGQNVIDEIKNDAATKDAVLMKNEMVVGVNTTSADDAKQIEDDGFSLPDADIHTIVTETDKIQAQLAKAGKDTSYFTGELSEAQLEEIAGSAALAAQYAAAYDQSQTLEALDGGAVKYMIANDLEPTIGNLYYAQFNGGRQPVSAPDASLDEDAITEQIRQVVIAAGLAPTAQNLEAGKWLAANELAVTPENLSYMNALQSLQLPPQEGQAVAAMAQAVAEGKTPADACLIDAYSTRARADEAAAVIDQTTDEDLAYVLSQGQELTIENLREAHRLLEAGEVEAPNAAGLTDGSDADTAGSSAVDFDRKVLNLLEARRVLEETRLVMTTEANYSLIKRGMEIDTKPLEQLVEDLRQQEQSYYKNLLEADGSTATSEQVALFQETIEVAEQLKWMPAYALGSEQFTGTSESLHQAGAALQSKLAAAGDAYETLMTAPRSDMGDSIQHAFRNVDDILRDIGMEPTDANARAVRILAYNQMEITPMSVTEMKLADRQVQDAFDSLKPAVVREMIRDGINPLQMDIRELNAQAQQIRTQIGGADEVTKFSEYLWKLEQNHSISQEERDSYIGVYRLIHQVEAGDGAAIGALVQQGAPITMENLLRAVRSGKKSGMDYTVDDQFGGVDQKSNGTSITDQIQAAFQTECFRQVQKIADDPQQFTELLSRQDWKQMTPEQLLSCMEQAGTDSGLDRAYTEQFLDDLQAAASSDPQVYEMLEAYDVPVTVNHVLAMQQMLANPGDALRRLFGMDEELSRIPDTDQKQELMEELSEAKDAILHKLGEHVQTPEELADAQQTLADVAEHCGQTVMYEGMSTLNIRQLQMMTAQLHLGVSMAKEERYQIPIVTSDGVTGVNVKIVRGSEKKGSVRITMDSATYGKVAAELQAGEKGISGYFASDSRAGADRLSQEQPRIEQLLSELDADTGLEAGTNEIHMLYSAHLDLVKFELSGEKSTGSADNPQHEIQTKQLYGIAEKVIRFLQEGVTKGAEPVDI